MAQFYQLKSLEEICRLYPNLQVENIDSVQYMVQDDKLIQYTDAQGKQVLTAVDKSSVQSAQNPSSSTQQGVFVIEAVETQSLENSKHITRSEQPQLVVQQINSTTQPSHQILGSQQSLILQQLEQGNNESHLYKEVTCSESKPQCILQMDSNKSQILNQQPRFVIHPIQANLVHVDSSKQQSCSLQRHEISNISLKHQVSDVTEGCTAKKIDFKELPVTQLEDNNVEYQIFAGQIDSINDQQLVVQPIETSSQKTIVEIEQQDRQLIMQPVDGNKQNSFIIQQLGSNNQLPNQILVNQLKGNKNHQAVIQNLEFTDKEPQAVKFPNIENTHFIMQRFDGAKQQQTQYQTQHFVVPQGDKLQPKLVVQRLEMHKQIVSPSQLIVQPFQTNRGAQYVVQKLDFNKQQNLLPYVVSSPKNSCSTESATDVDTGKELKTPNVEQRVKPNEKETEGLETKLTNNQNVSRTADNDGNYKSPEKRQEVICVVSDHGSHSKQLSLESPVGRIDQHSQTIETNDMPVSMQQQQSESHRRFAQHQPGQNHILRSPIQSAQQTQFYTKVRVAESHLNSEACGEVSKLIENTERRQSVQIQGQLQQVRYLSQEDKLDYDGSLKNKQDTLLDFDKNVFGVVPSISSVPVSGLQQWRRITLKQNESDTYPGGVFIIPKGENQICTSQYQSGLRFQGPQSLSLGVAQQLESESSKSQTIDKISQTGDVMTQNVVVQQNPSVSLPAALEDSQNLTGLNHAEIPVKSYVKLGSTEQSPVRAVEVASRLQQSGLNRVPTSMVTSSEQSSESGLNECERREMKVQSFGHNSNNNINSSNNSNASSLPTATVTQSHSQTGVRVGRGGGRGLRNRPKAPVQRGMLHCSSGGRGVQVQTNPIRYPQVDSTGIGKKPKDSKGVNSGVLGGNQPGPRPVIYQFANINTNSSYNNSHNFSISITSSDSSVTNTSSTVTATTTSSTGISNITSTIGSSVNSGNSSDITQGSQNVDETRMLVILPNGERKLVRLPNSQQNVHFSQLWQQVRVSLESQISLAAGDHTSEKAGTGQVLIRGVTLESQEPQTSQDFCNISPPAGSVHTPQNSGVVAASTVINTQQPRPRVISPRMITTSTRGRGQCNARRMPAPRIINHRMVAPPQYQAPQTMLAQNSTASATGIQIQPLQDSASPPKEPPKLIAGHVAICPFCGISSLDFNKCIRCRRKLPPNVKSQSIFNLKKKKPEKSNSVNDKTLDGTKSDSDDKNSETSNTEIKEKASSPLNDKKKPKQSPKKKKITDEPAEILILSSDDEEDGQTNRVDVTRELLVLSKEPVYETMHLSAEEIVAATKGHSLVDDLMENFQPGSYTTLHCRAVRIGSYRSQPKERIFISTKGIRLVVPSLKCEPVKIVIPSTEIMKILIHFGKQMPIVFIYATPKMAFRIRSQLNMENKFGPYYDPTSQDETHKRITLLLEKMTEDNKIALRSMFEQSKVLEELSEKEANEILVRASPSEEQGVLRPDTIRKIMIYPPPPEKGGIALNNQDYACLGEDQFLNDVIIDFYLKYLLLKVLTPKDRERTHVFSTFFYKRLTTKPKTMRKNDPENDPKLSPAEKRHMRVKGWTKQVNLFEKDFIIVPINEHSHWFLAIICFPGLTGPVKFSDNSPVEPEEVQSKKNTRTLQIGNTTITHIVKTDKHAVSLEMDPGSDRDEAEGDQDDLHQSSDDEESEHTEEELTPYSAPVEIPLLSSAQSSQVQSKEGRGKSTKKKTYKEPIKQPCILIFDSLAGASRVRVVATLRDYLKIEYKKKMGHDREFTKDTIRGAVPKVPQQNNFTDCGLYVLQYVESFFQDPLHDFKLPLKYLQDWFPEEVVSCKRQELACLIRSLMEEQGIKVDEIGLPTLTFTNGSNTGEEQAKLDDEEEEDDDDLEEGDDEDYDEEEEEEFQKNVTSVSEIDHEEDMDLDEEGEEPEREMEEEEEVYEELELDEVQKSQMHLNSSCRSQSEAEFHDYVNEVEDEVEGLLCGKQPEMQVTGQRKNVPLTEFQDFESQISCTTIEKNVENLASESDIVISEDETNFEVKNSEKVIVTTKSVTILDPDTTEIQENIASNKKNFEVKHLINKLINEKGITVSRREDGTISKQVDSQRAKMNCDTKTDESNDSSNCNSQKTNSSCVKRTFEALKSVRIPKKTERAVILNKRQKVDET